MHPALIACIQCPHPRAAHAPNDDALCRVNGCECFGYTPPDVDTGEPPAPTPNPLDARTLLVVIPEGFTATVELIPLPADVR